MSTGRISTVTHCKAQIWEVKSLSAFERNGLAEPLGLFEPFERLESHEPM